jgi:hypothetical protein
MHTVVVHSGRDSIQGLYSMTVAFPAGGHDGYVTTSIYIVVNSRCRAKDAKGATDPIEKS